MPLHLLGKKSWNVYNHDNVEKVRRDEAEAAAKEAAEDQRMQEVDSKRRIRLLQGLPIEELTEQPEATQSTSRDQTYTERDRKRRRRHGEDDTERDIRYARELQARHYDDQAIRPHKRVKDAPLHDTRGHINLFPEPKSCKEKDRQMGNPEAELENARKERELEDQYTLRFSNAAGFKQAVDSKPWYHGESIANDADQEVPTVNVWGKEDPRRKQREQIRMATDDPLAAIQKGVKGLRQVEKDRKDWKDRQRKDIERMIKEERQTAKKSNEDDLEGFSLDANTAAERSGKHREHRKHRHRHRHRSHEQDLRRSRSPHKHRKHGSSSKDR